MKSKTMRTVPLAASLLLAALLCTQTASVSARALGKNAAAEHSPHVLAGQKYGRDSGAGDKNSRSGDQCHCPPRVLGFDNDDHNCRCDFTRCGPAVIQHETIRVTGNSVTIFPRRPTVFAWFNCPGETAVNATFKSDCFKRAEKGVFGGRLSYGNQAGFYVSERQITPGKSCVVTMKSTTFTVNVREVDETSGVIVSHNLFKNIPSSNPEVFKGNVFNFITNPDYARWFRLYAQRLPISHMTLLQTAPLHSVSAKEVGEGVPGPLLDALKTRQSIHVTCDICGTRRCDGGPYQGKHNHYTGQGAEGSDALAINIAGMLGNLDYEHGVGPSTISSRATNVINKVAYYEDGMQIHGYYAMSYDRIAFLVDTTKANKQENVLPHELGHTFGLPDNNGAPNSVEKLMTYAVIFEEEDVSNTAATSSWCKVRVVNPYMSTPQGNRDGFQGTRVGWKSGSMNNALLEKDDGMFSRYDNKELKDMQIHWETVRQPIDRRINLSLKGETTIVMSDLNCGLRVSRINIVWPTSGVHTGTCRDQNWCVKVRAVYANCKEKKLEWDAPQETGKYTRHRGSFVALPQDMNGYDYLIVEFAGKQLKRYFTIGNDAVVLPDPLSSFSPA